MISKLSNSSLLSKPYYKNMLAGNPAYEPPGDFDLISSTILGSNTSTVTLDFSSLAALGYKHLQIRIFANTTLPSSGTSRLRMLINGQTSGYRRHEMELADSRTYFGSGSRAEFNGSLVLSDRIPGTQNNASLGGIMDIYNAFSGKPFSAKFAVTAHVDTGNAHLSFGSIYHSTTSLTSMTFGNGNQAIGDEGYLAAGSRFSVYGIKG